MSDYLDDRFDNICKRLDDIQKSIDRLEDRMYVFETRLEDSSVVSTEIEAVMATMNEFVSIVGSTPYCDL